MADRMSIEAAALEIKDEEIALVVKAATKKSKAGFVGERLAPGSEQAQR